MKYSDCSQWNEAQVSDISKDRVSFSSSELDGFSPSQKSILVHDFKSSKKEWNTLEDNEELVLTWNVLELGEDSKSDSSAQDLVKEFPVVDASLKDRFGNRFLHIPYRLWSKFLSALKEVNFKTLLQCSEKICSEIPVTVETLDFDEDSQLPCETTFSSSGKELFTSVHTRFFRKHDHVHLLLGSGLQRHLIQPVIQAVKVSNSLICCVQHRRRPAACFADTVECPTKRKYASVQEYTSVFLPLIIVESSTNSVSSDVTTTIIHDVTIKWENTPEGIHVKFQINKFHCLSKNVTFSCGDFVCVRYVGGSDSSQSSRPVSWFGHCRVIDSLDEERDPMSLSVSAMLVEPHAVRERLLNELSDLACSIELIPQWLPYRRMIWGLRQLQHATPLVQSIFLKRSLGEPKPLANMELLPGVQLDESQAEAVRTVLKSPLTLIWGPPGTGKTHTGAYIVRQFVELNRREENQSQVLYCGPSNQAVDMAAKMLRKLPGVRMLRVYGRTIENQSFPEVSAPHQLSPNQQYTFVDGSIKEYALHFRIRSPANPFASDIITLEEEIAGLRKQLNRTGAFSGNLYDELALKLKRHHKLIKEAEKYEFRGVNVVLCTCTETGSQRLRSFTNITQCIMDECSMVTEPEGLVPMVAAGKSCRWFVLIGDHKQLAPVLQSSVVKRLGFGRSLFENLFKNPGMENVKICMLRTQYRMHPSIRKFPSQQFYQGMLVDARVVTQPERMSVGDLPSFWPAGAKVHVVFCHIAGQEDSPQDLTGVEGREESKFNEMEAEHTVTVVKSLMARGVSPKQISVFTPYNAQKNKIQAMLKREMRRAGPDVEVLSVVASQGSERDFVVISTVRSQPENDILPNPSPSWQSSHLGFLTDERQINVAITRARHGLVIIGNRHLLSVYPMWKNLVQHYQHLGCLVNHQNWPKR